MGQIHPHQTRPNTMVRLEDSKRGEHPEDEASRCEHGSYRDEWIESKKNICTIVRNVFVLKNEKKREECEEQDNLHCFSDSYYPTPVYLF
jgi:hypothetical protein